MAEQIESKILLVESNKIALRVLESELGILDVELLTATTSDEAITVSEQLKPDLIILETELPDNSGIETCTALKNNLNTSKIPVFFVSQLESDEERKNTLSSGGLFYCPIPFERGVLAKRVRDILSKEDKLPPQKVLVAEDSRTIRTIICNILTKEGHEVTEAEDGLMAWEILQEGKDFDLIVSDINMPRMDGSQLVKLIRGSSQWEMVPIIVASTMADKENIASLLNSGADDYIIKPFVTEEFLARIKSHVRVRYLYDDLNNANEKLKTFTESLEKMVEFRTLELLEANMASIMMLAVASEYRDTDTGNHVKRIGGVCKILALKMGYSATKAEEISYSSILHDVGKLGVPDAVLKKPGKLTPEEFDMMKVHTIHGAEILSGNPFFEMAQAVARHHHEKFNGKGYPDGLSGYEIPLVARITSVADVFDALTSKRVYKEAWPEDKAFQMIVDSSGEDFDPMVVDAFADIYKSGEVQEIRKKYK